MRKLPIFALSALALAVTAPDVALAELPFPATEFFPVEPEVNAERGFAVAVEGDWLAMGAPRDDSTGEKDAGAVYLFQWSGTAWDQKAKLFAKQPQEDAQLGFALAMRQGVLAAGAPGAKAVYLFTQEGGVWREEEEKKLTGPSGSDRPFGVSVAFGGDWLAVGAVDPRGETPGAVHLFATAPPWGRRGVVRPRRPQAGERFGQSISLSGRFLVVGAPGHDGQAADTGRVYVFERQNGGWGETDRLLGEKEGDQVGLAVATDGMEIFAGAPTADKDDDREDVNSGAVYRFVRRGGRWVGQGRLEVGTIQSGDQLGASLALSGDLLAVGAPAPTSETGRGKIHVFRRADGVWEPLEQPLVPANAEIRDLAGFAVAVNDERVVAGGALGDQGAGAAGAAWSFRCPDDPDDPDDAECFEQAEAVARDDLSGRRFGVSLALTKDFMAVGAPEIDPSFTGAVYLYRRVEGGWRQERRLTSASAGDGFGSSVALEGSLLAVGAPQADSLNGSVTLYVRSGSFWSSEKTLSPSPEAAFGKVDSAAFGTSVAIAEGVVAVGAPGSRTVHLFQRKELEGWTEIRVLTAPAEVEGFGAAVSLRDGVLAIGAPRANHGAGAVYVSVRGDGDTWKEPQPLPEKPPNRVAAEVEEHAPTPRALGSSVVVGDGFIAAGAPGVHNHRGVPPFGAVFLFEGAGTTWVAKTPLRVQDSRRLGASVALYRNHLATVGPGAAVACSHDFIVVTSPDRSAREELLTIFDLPAAAGGLQ